MKSTEEFIKEMVQLYNDISTSDLQGIVEARCMQTGEDEDELLNEIYQIIDSN